MAGQTIQDRLLAAKHSLAGQGLAKSVCKATTEELLGPKKKHLDYLVHCTNEPNVSIPQMANLLIERSQNTSWVVVYKSLITTHHVMCYGNERFTQYLASSNVSFQLSNFVDKTGVQSAVGARTGYDMSPFIRRYARYLNEKALSYRAVAFDFCKVKRGKEEGTLRTMNAENLLKTLPILQNQLDALLEFDCTANDLTNGVINMCFMLLFRDLIRLFACYNDGIINLLEKFFEMNKKQCREALDLYKKFLIRMDRVAEFLKVAENIGIDKGDIPDLTRAPNSLLDTLEQHLASLEGNTPTTANNQKIKSGVSVLSNTSNAFGSAVDDSFQQAALAEEEAVLNQYKANLNSPVGSTNPFLSEDPPQAQPQQKTNEAILDLFGAEPVGTAPAVAPMGGQGGNALDDLLGLGNPFADFGAPAGAPTGGMDGGPFGGTQNWATNGFQQQQQQPQQFGEDSNDYACPASPTVPHSFTTLVEGFQSENLAIPNTVVQINCINKYRNSRAPCQPGKLKCIGGQWVGTTPICVPARDCDPPPAVSYAVIYSLNPAAYETSITNKYPIKSQISYQCLPGYTLQGVEVSACSTGGCWLPAEPPTCYRSPSYYLEVNNINAILISGATGAGVLGLLLVICLVVMCRRRKPLSRAVAIAPPVPRSDLGDHATLLHHPDRLALIAFADGIQNDQSALPTYDEATRERGPGLISNRLHRPHWPNLAMGRRSRNPNQDVVHVTRHGSFASHTPSTRSVGDSMGSTDTVAISEGSTNVTLDTVSSHSGSQPASCRVHCGSLASFDTSSVINTEGVPLLEENELEENQCGDNISLVVENPSLSDSTSFKLSTHSTELS